MYSVLSKSVIAALLLCAAAYAQKDSTPDQKMPLREIDRPMILPRGLLQATANGGIALEYKERRIIADNRWYYNPAGLIPRRALSRRLEFPAFGFPYLRCLISNHDIGDTVLGVRNNFAMTLSSGVTALTFSGRDGFGAIISSAVEVKLTPSQYYWYEGELGAETSLNGEDYDSGNLGVLLGVQLSQKLSATMGLEGNIYVVDNRFAKNDFYTAGFPLSMQYHFNTFISASVGLTPLVDWDNSQRNYYGVVDGAVQWQW
jgi:hypothetical protein